MMDMESSVGAPAGVFVIGEMSGNHNGNLDRAFELVDAIALTGAQAVKIQTYTADTLTINVDLPRFRVQANHTLWGGRNLYSLYQEAHTPWEWHRPIFDRARAHGLVPFSTPFDPTSVEFLESLDVTLYKTASAEIVDLPLMREIGRTGKPMIVSTGMATLREIEDAVGAASDAGCSDITLLVCTASYPADPAEARLGNIDVLKKAFGLPVGLSDHTLGIGTALAAIAMGAEVVEKHVTLRRSDGGVDADFSAEPGEIKQLVEEARSVRAAVASPIQFGPTTSERAVLELRRSLYVVQDVKAGDLVTAKNVRSIRPAGGLPADAFGLVEGRAFSQDVSRGTPLTWSLI